MAESEVAICNLAILKAGASGDLIGSLDDKSLMARVCKLEYPEVRDELFALFKWPRATRHAYPAQLGGAAWAAPTTYAKGAFVSYAPAAQNVANLPETGSTFVYVSLQGANTGNAPDSSPTWWAQVSRPAYAYVFQLPGDVISVQGLYKYGRNPRYDQQVPYELGDDDNVGATLLYTDTGLPWDVLSAQQNPVSIELVYTGQLTDPKRFPPLFTKALYWSLAVTLALDVRKDPAAAEKAQAMATAVIAQAKKAAQGEQQKDPAPMPSHIAARFTRRRGGYRW